MPLTVAAVRCLAGDVEAGQREHADLLLDDLAARPDGQALPRLFAGLVRLPHEAPAFGHPIEGVGVGEGLRVAAEDDIDVAEIAVDADAIGGGDHEVGRRRALLLRAVLRIGADVDDFLGVAEVVQDRKSTRLNSSHRT